MLWKPPKGLLELKRYEDGLARQVFDLKPVVYTGLRPVAK